MREREREKDGVITSDSCRHDLTIDEACTSAAASILNNALYFCNLTFLLLLFIPVACLGSGGVYLEKNFIV